jgi:UDP-N-acetylmuramoyl-tripeptide--D-alanyl-D-alanine ligase
MLRLREVMAVLSGAVLFKGAEEVRFDRVTTDSRQLAEGDLFVALSGDRFDGHQFVSGAAAKGAAALLVSQPVDSELPTILVPDTRMALGELARLWRRRFPIPLIAVVGSNGKTTTKEMIASILRQTYGEEGYLATTGNLNNEIGVPLTLLGLKTRHRAAVVEIGMNHPGETAWLAAVAEPTICVITNAQREHQEFMSSVAAVADEHALALKALPENGVAVLPVNDAHYALWRAAADARRVIAYIATASKNDAALELVGAAETVTGVAYVAPFDTVAHFNFEDNTITAHLATAGLHNVHNAAAATAAAVAAHVDALHIAAGLEHFVPVAGRMQRRSHSRGGLLIDDSYNANPDSVLAAIAVLADSPAPRLLVLGDMGEVGAGGISFHEEIGQATARFAIDLMALGELSVHAVKHAPGARHFSSIEDLTAAALAWLTNGPDQSSVLVKGSRFMQMERVSRALQGQSALQSERSH